jgi:hypothetical protein
MQGVKPPEWLGFEPFFTRSVIVLRKLTFLPMDKLVVKEMPLLLWASLVTQGRVGISP